jgi:hypothetical protein
MAEPDPPHATDGEDRRGALGVLRAVGRGLLALPRAFWAVAAAAWIALIWYLSDQSMEQAPAGPLWRFLANGVHVPLFGLLALWLALALPRAPATPRFPGCPRLGVGLTVLIVLLVSAYGGVDEWHQSWSGRSPQLTDWLTDTVAATWVVVVAASAASTTARPATVARLLWSGLALSLVAVALATWPPGV